jgi:hypothetical protein
VHAYVLLVFFLLNQTIDEELHVRSPETGEVHEGLEEIKFLSFWHHEVGSGILLQTCCQVLGIELLLKKLLE